MARIDILLPVKNGKDYLAEAIDSVIAQTYTDWRLLVLDHGSTDGSVEMAQAYHARDPRIEVHSFPQAKGLSGLLNCGIDIADCEFIMRHDADDICLPDRMALTLAAFEAQPESIVVSGQADVIDATGNKLDDLRLPVGTARIGAASLFRNPVSHPASTLRFDPVQKMGVRYGVDILKVLPENQRIDVPSLAEDYFLFGQLAILGKVTNLPQKLLKYRWQERQHHQFHRTDGSLAGDFALADALVLHDARLAVVRSGAVLQPRRHPDGRRRQAQLRRGI
jgi:glycosyltransferase involved in cell wall biosynthesis